MGQLRRVGDACWAFISFFSFRSLIAMARYDFGVYWNRLWEATDPPGDTAHTKPGVVLYFSSQAQSNCLEHSIRSLNAHGGAAIERIWVCADKRNPLAPEAKNKLRKLSDFKIDFLVSKHPLRARGTERIASELDALRSVFSKMGAHQYALKLDSDTTVLSPKLFALASNRRASLIGQANQIKIRRKVCRRMQSGCYFIKQPALRAVLDSLIFFRVFRLAIQSGRRVSRLPVDLYLFAISEAIGLSMELLDYYLPVEKIRAVLKHPAREATLQLETDSRYLVHYENDRNLMPALTHLLLGPSR